MELARIVVIAAAVAVGVPRAHAAPTTIEVETADATPHDRALFEAIARELSRDSGMPTRGAKTFRLKTYARGGVRALTELGGGSGGGRDHVVACKLFRNRLWALKLRSTEVRTVVVTFRFRPGRAPVTRRVRT